EVRRTWRRPWRSSRRLGRATSRARRFMSTAACTWVEKWQCDSVTMRTFEFRAQPTRGKEPAMENVEQRVKKIVAEQLGVNEAEIKNESSFVDDLGADSLDTVELVMALEEEFETEIPDEEAEKITTVQQAIAYVSAHSKKA